MENANTEASKPATKPANEKILYGKRSVDDSNATRSSVNMRKKNKQKKMIDGGVLNEYAVFFFWIKLNKHLLTEVNDFNYKQQKRFSKNFSGDDGDDDGECVCVKEKQTNSKPMK